MINSIDYSINKQISVYATWSEHFPQAELLSHGDRKHSQAAVALRAVKVTLKGNTPDGCSYATIWEGLVWCLHSERRQSIYNKSMLPLRRTHFPSMTYSYNSQYWQWIHVFINTYLGLCRPGLTNTGDHFRCKMHIGRLNRCATAA